MHASITNYLVRGCILVESMTGGDLLGKLLTSS